jgi:hypothetical protein
MKYLSVENIKKKKEEEEEERGALWFTVIIREIMD